jgi:PAS domain S-box-containing protein
LQVFVAIDYKVRSDVPLPKPVSKRGRQMTLRWHIALVIAGFVVVTSTVLLFVFNHQLSSKHRQDYANWSATLTRAVAKAILRDTLDNKRPDVHDALRRIIKDNPDIVYLEIVGFDGKLFASTFDGDPPPELGTLSHPTCHPGDTIAVRLNGRAVQDICYPLVENLDAHLHLGVNQELLNRSTAQATQQTIAISALIVVAAVVVAALMATRIARPIRQLADSMRAFGRGETVPADPPRHADAEVRELARSFESMRQERKATEEALRRTQFALDHAPDGAFWITEEGYIDYVNEHGCRSLGYKHDELIGKHISTFNPRFSPERWPSQWALGKQQGTRTFETEHHRKDGTVFPVEVSTVHVRYGDQDIRVSFVRDITDRKAAEAELEKYRTHLEERVRERTAELESTNRMLETEITARACASEAADRFRTALDSAPDGIYLIDPSTMGFVDANRAGWETLGYTRSELLTLGPLDVNPDYDREELTAVFERVIAGKQTLGVIETSHRRKDGTLFPIELSLRAIPILSGHLLLATTRDISLRKETEAHLIHAKEEAERANLAKSEFLARMSHELRTPMNAILGFSQVLEMEPITPEQMDCVSEIHVAGDHLLALIDELLDLSQIEAGKLTTTIETVWLGGIVEQAAQLVQSMLPTRNVTLTTECETSMAVLADQIRLKQIVVNLLSNAVKYNRVGGHVIIACRELDQYMLRLSVSDTGPGIPPEKLGGLFMPFERLGAEFTNVKGTGIGLSLSRRLAELMGATMGVDSTPGQGSTFWVDLPRSELVAQALPVDAPVAAPRQDRSRVLYVEDNPANLKVVEAIFRRHPNLLLFSAVSGKAGLELARRYVPEVILLDIHLPDMDGYGVLKELQAHPETRNIPVIALSADAMPVDIERGAKAGFKQYLTKPIKIDELTEAIWRLLASAPATLP